jgi:YD repeat-containing protein
MKTWQDVANPATAAHTFWFYHPQRGWLQSKRYPFPVDWGTIPEMGPDYEYTDAGRLQTRTWARGTTTTYSYNHAGELSGTSYSDGTPSLAMGSDRRGRMGQVTQGALITTRSYNDADQILGESHAGGSLNGLSVVSAPDAFLRRQTLQLKNGGATLRTHTYGYDNASRLSTVNDGANLATYGYLPNSPLVGQLTFRQGQQPTSPLRLTTTRQYDQLNRLSSIDSVNTEAVPSSSAFSYGYNAANQRVATRLADGSQWVYEYDKLGQVKSGKRYWNDATPVAGQQFEYAFDDIGNRTVSKAGGDENGANLRSTTYATDLLNRYVSRTASSTAVDVIGAAKATASVAVNTVPVTTRKAEYYWMEFPVDVSGGADYPSISVTATEGANQNTVPGNIFVPQNPEVYQDGVTPGYDEDGNPLRDGRWTYTWDAENRLTKIESRPEHLGPLPAAGRKIECEYDYLGRRIRKKTSAWNAGPENWDPPTERKFVYDGWNLVGIFDANNALLQSFAWGSDLSGTMQGAGGVGGLLSMTVHSGANAGTYFYSYDGNGNVAALVNAADGAVVARYEYGPFGEVIRATGPLAKENPFRFSTKYQDDETDLLYYGYRYYNASTGEVVGPRSNWGTRFQETCKAAGEPTEKRLKRVCIREERPPAISGSARAMRILLRTERHWINR